MILEDTLNATGPTSGGHESDLPAVRATLDDLFRRAAATRPDALALIDPPDRVSFTDGPVRRLTYAQADRAISALAARLRGFGLPTDSVVAIQLPNTVESVIALLAILRAGLIAAPLPLLWRHADAAAALGRVAARALIGCQRIGDTVHGDLAMHIAMETFTIRFLCGFGENLPDGVVPIDDIFSGRGEPPVVERYGEASDHVALVTFDIAAEGIVPIARTHAELIAGGLAVHLEARIEPDAVILGALALASFAGLATAVVPWLLTGGTLVLHHPFAPAVFEAQRADEHCTVAVLPGAMVMRLAEAGLIGRSDGSTVLAVWRAPERLGACPVWSGGTLVDIPVFGEIGLIAARRGPDGKPSMIPSGRLVLPRGAARGIHVLNLARTPAGTLALSGPMVPHATFPPGSERNGAPKLKITDANIDTGYACRVDRESKMLIVDGPPGGIVSVGGYRFALRAAQDLVAGIEDGSTLAALPDMLAGHRLAGAGADRDTICDALLAHGANPLLVAAFRARKPAQQASAA
ncbi:MAG: acyl--CoA ligase [Alphaproteobacteria bacterium]|nr:MAG: acyl--CoA ligase [Alphaproteobacteria bacterium]